MRRSVAKNSVESQKQEQKNLIIGLKNEGKTEISNKGNEEYEQKLQRVIEVKQMHQDKKIKEQEEV